MTISKWKCCLKDIINLRDWLGRFLCCIAELYTKNSDENIVEIRMSNAIGKHKGFSFFRQGAIKLLLRFDGQYICYSLGCILAMVTIGMLILLRIVELLIL